jgi:tetratricopeptide (TPR) repeat protein
LHADEFLIIDILKSYVSYVTDTSQSFMDTGNLKPA